MYSTREPSHALPDGGTAAATSLANRTVRPSWYTGWTSGLPGSRLSLNSLNRVLKLGGPANSTPVVRLRMAFAPVNADSPPNTPRLSPATNSLGRCPGGRVDQTP